MFQELLKKMAQELDAVSIDYMVIGGQAVLLYGEPRLTQDIDITLGVGSERLPDIRDIVKKMGWNILVKNPTEFVQRTMILPVQDPQSRIRIVFIFSFSPFEQQAMKRVRKVYIEQTPVRFASPEDLIIHKIIAGRPRDLEDVEGILLKNPNIDPGYIIEWLKHFEETLEHPLVEQFEELRKKCQ